MDFSAARDIVVTVALHYLGGFYRWGGDDPSGFDCSGLVIECLQSVGLVGRGKDAAAAGLFTHFADGFYMTANEPKTPGVAMRVSAQRGDLVFWRDKSGRIVHVEIVINDELSVGASGGGADTLSVADAIEQNAFIRIRPFRSRANLAGFVCPYGLNPL